MTDIVEPNINVKYIAGYLRVSSEFARELHERAIGRLHGPDVPMPLTLWRRLGGHPVGPYRTTP